MRVGVAMGWGWARVRGHQVFDPFCAAIIIKYMRARRIVNDVNMKISLAVNLANKRIGCRVGSISRAHVHHTSFL